MSFYYQVWPPPQVLPPPHPLVGPLLADSDPHQQPKNYIITTSCPCSYYTSYRAYVKYSSYMGS